MNWSLERITKEPHLSPRGRRPGPDPMVWLPCVLGDFMEMCPSLTTSLYTIPLHTSSQGVLSTQEPAVRCIIIQTLQHKGKSFSEKYSHGFKAHSIMQQSQHSGPETTQGHLRQHPTAAGFPVPHCAGTQAAQPPMTETKERHRPSTQSGGHTSNWTSQDNYLFTPDTHSSLCYAYFLLKELFAQITWYKLSERKCVLLLLGIWKGNHVGMRCR